MKPQSYMVSLEIETESLSLDELTSLIGIEGDDNSVNKGDEYTWLNETSKAKYTAWKFDSDAGREANLNEHFQALREQIDIPEIRKANLPADADIYLNIGVLYYTLTSSFELPTDWMKFFAENNIRISVICYPCSDDEDEATG